jgi:hypothetical protein
MKLYVVGGCAVFIAIVAIFISQLKPSDPQTEWKRFAVEKETKVRPAYFEDMKFHPGATVRAPASSGK